MTSLRAHLYVPLVRAAVRARLGRRPTLASIRKTFNQPGFKPSKGMTFTPGSVGGVPGEWVNRETGGAAIGPGRPRLLYLHGGGFVGCSARLYRALTARLAKAGFCVFAPDYRLAPEHPFPAAIEDVAAIWAEFSEAGPAVIGGDSAGGNLALALMGEARGRGLPMPVAACLFSPATDLLGRSASYPENAEIDAMFRPEALKLIAELYLDGADPLDPRISPVEADLSGFPPLLIHAAEREMLRDDSVRLAERARAFGVPVELKIWPVVPHAWQLAGGYLPEARNSLLDAAGFLMRELAANGSTRAQASAG